MEYSKVICFSILALTAAWPVSGAVRFFDYEIPDYPVAPASCQKIANALGDRFRSQTGLEVYQVSCAEKGATASKIKINYLAEEAPPVETTEDRFSGVISRGLYRSRAACAADLPNQIDFFRKGTGLEPFVSYCFQYSQFADEPYSLRIDAFGESDKHAYLDDALFFKGRNLEDAVSLGKRIFDAASAQGVEVAFAAIVSEWPYYKVVLRYYSDIRISLATSSPMTFDSANGCANGRAAFERINQQALNQPLALFCSARQGQLSEVTLNQVSLQSSGINQSTAPDVFTTSAACFQKLPSIEILYRQTFKKNVVGTYCDGIKGAFRAQVFTKGSTTTESIDR